MQKMRSREQPAAMEGANQAGAFSFAIAALTASANQAGDVRQAMSTFNLHTDIIPSVACSAASPTFAFLAQPGTGISERPMLRESKNNNRNM